MNRSGTVAVALSLLLHAAGGYLLFKSDIFSGNGRGAASAETLPVHSLRLVDPADLPGETVPPKRLTPLKAATEGIPVPDNPLRDMSPEEGAMLPATNLALTGRKAGHDGIFEDLPGGGSYPGPDYPERARREGREGTVVVLIEVDGEGRIGKVTVDTSEGGSDFARSALKAVGAWRFPEGTEGTYRRRFLFRLKS